MADAKGAAGHASYILKTAAEQIWDKKHLNKSVCSSFLEFGLHPCALAKEEFSVYVHHITPVKGNGSFWPVPMKSRNGTIQSKLCCVDSHNSTPLKAWHITAPHKPLKQERSLNFWLFCNETYKSIQVLWHLQIWNHPVHGRLDGEHRPPAFFTSSTAQIRSTQTLLVQCAGVTHLRVALENLEVLGSSATTLWCSPATTLWAPVFSLFWGADGRCPIKNGRGYQGMVHPLWNILFFSQKLGVNRAGQRSLPEYTRASVSTKLLSTSLRSMFN